MLEVVPFSLTHLPGVIDAILPIQRDEFGFAITVDDQPDLLDIPGFYQHGQGNFWVAVSDGVVVGTIGLRDIGNNQGALRKMFVRSTHRGKEHGVASRLLDELISFATSAGVRDVFLGTTEKFVAAHRFYEKNGFVQISAAELPEAFPRMAFDTRFYRRVLTFGAA
jgi:N-acetylglutamate synthase-like GNAT family acetyltransferase